MMRTTVCAAGLVRRALRAAFIITAVSAPIGAMASSAAAADAPPAGQPGVLKYPEPSPFPISWELKFKYSEPKRIVVHLANQQYATAYWYITYTAINRGDKEVPFEPEFDMLANDGKVYRGNLAIPDVVFDAIRKREGNNLLELPRKVIGTINPGEDQAKDSMAVWQEPASTRQMGTFSIFVAGLSGESLTMKKVGDQYVPVDPKKAADELKGVKEEDRLLLRKQLQLTYQVMGDEANVGKDPVVKKQETWVMR